MWPIDVVAFWNGAQMRDLLEAIVFIVGGADFAGLARSVVLVGLLAAVIGGIVRWRHESMYMFVVVFVVSAMVLLVPRTPVTVRDVRAGTAYVVNDVPVGAAFLVTLSSRLGYWLGNAFESAFIPVSDEAARFTRFGMAFPQRAVEAIRSVGAVTPTGRGFLNALMSECVVLEMIENPARAQEVFASANLEMTITQAGWLNPARYVVGPDGLSRSCPIMAIDTFNYLRANEVPQLQRLLGAQLVGMEPNPTAAVSGAIASAETALLNLSRSFADAAMQSMLRAGVGDGLQQSSHPDAVALASAFAAAQANVSSVINYRTMSKIAETLLPTLRNAVEFVALAAFPIVIVLVMGAGIGGAVLLRGYVMIFAWLALWPPLYAVVNYLMVRVDGSPMSRLLTEYGGDTMVAAKLIQHMGATSQDMAGMLAILVPVIAFALVRGGDIAASSLVSGILGPASSAGQAQGSSLAQGNVSLGNVAWSSAAMNRVEGNSMNLVPSAAYGMGGSFQNAYGTHVTGLGGSVTAAAARPIDLGASVQMDHSAVARQASASAIVSNFARNVQATLTDGSTAGLGSQAVAEQTRAALEALNRQVGATHGSETYSGASSASGGGSATNVTEGSDVATGARAGLGGNASDRPITSGASGKGVPGKRAVPSWLQVLSAIGEAGVSIRADDVSRSARELQGFSRGEIQEGARELRNALEQIANTSSDQATRSGARRLMAGLDKTLSAMQSEGVGLTRTDSGSRTVSVELGGGSRMSFDLNGLVLQAAQREYGSLDKAMEAARTDPLGYQARMQQAMQGVMESLLQKISAQYAADLKTPEQIDKQVQQAVNDAASMFGKRVEERNTENQGKVAKKQADNGTPPGTPVRLDGHGAHSEVQELAEKNLQENAEQAAMMKGAASAVQQLMAQPKWERMWSAAKGMAGEAPQLVKPASALLDQASSDEGLRALLLKAGGGARLSDSELEQVAARLSASRR